MAKVRRLLADLRRPETRRDALRRVRRRTVRVLRGRTGESPKPRAHPDAIGDDAGPGEASRSGRWYAERWSRLAAAVLGPNGGPRFAAADPTLPAKVAKQAGRQRAEALFAEAIARGEPLERAACETVGSLADLVEHHAAWALAEGVGRLPGGATASALGHAVLVHRRRQFERILPRIGHLDDATLARTIPIEAVDGALATGTQDARRRALAIATPGPDLGAATLVDLAGRMFAFGEKGRAADLLAELRRRPQVDLDPGRRQAWRLIEGWLEHGPTTVPEGSIPVAVLGYRSPDPVLTSGNLGDYIQSLSLVGNLVRLSGVTFSGDDGLGELANELQGRIRPELRVADVAGSVHLIPVDRELTTATDVPEGTWLVAFGWHMHPLYDLRYDFPYHPNLRPLFLSFHVNRLDMLDEQALAYLREHAPIGCRDWSTVFMLLGAGIDAFFSGCLTSTVDALYPPRGTAYSGKGVVGLIDLPRAPEARDGLGTRAYSHQSDDHRSMPLAAGLRAADHALAAYQRDLSRAVTGRLHAYLPLTSIGVPVEFRTGSPGDVRFAGLTGLRPGDARLIEMQAGIRELITKVFERILAGADEAEVYRAWRDLTRDRVAAAKARFDAPVQVKRTTIDVAAAVATSRSASRRFGPHDRVDPKSVTDVVLSFDQNVTLPAAVVIESIVANASGPVRLWVLSRGLTAAYQEWLAGAFPALPITFLPCDGIAYGPRGRSRRIPSRITVSTMDRLLLPDLLEGVDRVVYLDVDTLVLGDVVELARTDLAGRPVAARDSNVSEASEWQRAGRGLDEALATELRRSMALRHGFGHPALNAGVLVLNLERMRRDDFTATYLGWVERYGFHDQDTMLAYVGPDRAVLDPRWNALPVLEDIRDPWLIHWATFNKPWEQALSFEQERWHAYAATLRARAGAPPTSGAAGAAPSGPEGTLGNPMPVGPGVATLPAEVERVIGRVRGENLSYLDDARLRSLAEVVRATDAAAIRGVIVEAGTARGGSAITMTAAKSGDRPMKVYDVFGMIPPPGEKDGKDVHRRYKKIVRGESKGIGAETYYGYREGLLAEVTESFARYGLPIADNHVELIQGRFQDTLTLDEPVALAHLDGDWYESTMTCLTRIAPLLSLGGRIVVDDYDTWSGCRAAVDEYFTGRAGYRFERHATLHIVREPGE